MLSRNKKKCVEEERTGTEEKKGKCERKERS